MNDRDVARFAENRTDRKSVVSIVPLPNGSSACTGDWELAPWLAVYGLAAQLEAQQ